MEQGRAGNQTAGEMRASYGLTLAEQRAILDAHRHNVIEYESAIQAQVRAELEGKTDSDFIPKLEPVPEPGKAPDSA